MRNIKKIVLFFVVSILIAKFTTATTCFINHPIYLKASDIIIPIANAGKTISLLELSTITKVELEKVTERKMGLLQSILFKSTQRKIARGIDKNGFVTNKILLKIFRPKKDNDKSFTGGFLLGFSLNIFGVLLAYLIKDDKQKKRIKYAWIGFAVCTVGVGIGYLIFLSTFKLDFNIRF